MQEIKRVVRENGGMREVIDRLTVPEDDNTDELFALRRLAAIQRHANRDKPEEIQIREHRRIGRNDPCPCGSQKKFKKCCGRNIKSTDTRIK